MGEELLNLLKSLSKDSFVIILSLMLCSCAGSQVAVKLANSFDTPLENENPKNLINEGQKNKSLSNEISSTLKKPKPKKRISSSRRPRALFEKAPSWKKEPFPTEPFLTHSLDPAWLHSKTSLAAGSHRNEDEEATATNASPGVRKSCHLFALGV